jgi:hypothetical protein
LGWHLDRDVHPNAEHAAHHACARATSYRNAFQAKLGSIPALTIDDRLLYRHHHWHGRVRQREGVSSTSSLLFLIGGIGLAAMVIAVGLGVWTSIRISIGEAAAANPSFTWWVINRLAFLVGTTNLSSFAVYFLQGRLGYAEEKAAEPASQLMMVVGVFILISALSSGWLSDKFGHKRLVTFSGIVASLGTLIIILTTNLNIIYVGGCIIGVATGFFFTANWALGTELVPKKEAGRYLGISNLAGAGAGAVGAYIGGPVADFFTARVPEVPGLGYVLLFAIYGILFLLSAAALTQVKKRT